MRRGGKGRAGATATTRSGADGKVPLGHRGTTSHGAAVPWRSIPLSYLPSQPKGWKRPAQRAETRATIPHGPAPIPSFGPPKTPRPLEDAQGATPCSTTQGEETCSPAVGLGTRGEKMASGTHALKPASPPRPQIPSSLRRRAHGWGRGRGRQHLRRREYGYRSAYNRIARFLYDRTARKKLPLRFQACSNTQLGCSSGASCPARGTSKRRQVSSFPLPTDTMSDKHDLDSFLKGVAFVSSMLMGTTSTAYDNSAIKKKLA